MNKGKRRAGRFEVEWVTISYRTLLRWFLGVAAIVLLAGGIYLGFRLESAGELRDVQRLLVAVERELAAARTQAGAGSMPPEIALATEHLGRAKSALDTGNVPTAKSEISEARQALRQIASGPADRARLLRIEGQVQVKAVGALDWSAARVNLPLVPGDIVKTGPDSGAQILNLDGSTMELKADSLLKIERSAKDLVSGKTDVAVVMSFGELSMATTEMQPAGSTSEVKTPNVSASVERNSVVGVVTDKGGERSRINMLKGSARVRSGSSLIEVGPSEQLSVSPEGLERRKLPGIPQLLSPSQYKLLLKQDLAKRPLDLEWESIRDARTYRVELAQTPLFTKTTRVWDQHPTNYISGIDLAVGKYFWRATAVDREGVEGGPSPAGVFQVSDALPEGDPPVLRLTSVSSLGENIFLFEGRTQPGVFLSIDDGSKLVTVQPGLAGEFKQVITMTREGMQTVTVTARNSEGLESKVAKNVEVHFQ